MPALSNKAVMGPLPNLCTRLMSMTFAEDKVLIFTALHGMQTRSYDENSLCPSVCPSVKCMHCDKTEESYVQIFISHERTFILVF